MSLRDTIIAAVGAGFASIGGIPTPGSVVIRGSLVYNPVTGQSTATGDLSLPVNGVLYDIKQDRPKIRMQSGVDVQSPARVTKSYLIQATELKGNIPTNQDYLQIGATRWTIEDVAVDPVGATVILTINSP
jgi:hypothetical protein